MLENYKLVFDDLPWFEAGDGMRYKRIQQGDTQLRLVEWDRAMVHANWCFKGHIGYVIEGEVEIDIAVTGANGGVTAGGTCNCCRTNRDRGHAAVCRSTYATGYYCAVISGLRKSGDRY